MVARRPIFSVQLTPEEVNTTAAKLQMWAASFQPAVVLNSNGKGATAGHHSWEILVAAGESTRIFTGADAFSAVKEYREQKKDWLFGYWGYDLKNTVEPGLHSTHPDKTGFPDSFFFEPLHVAGIDSQNCLHIFTYDQRAEELWQHIQSLQLTEASAVPEIGELKATVSRELYLSHVQSIIQHIVEGDVYELNYCMEFYAEQARLNPFSTFQHLCRISPVPFAAYLQVDSCYLMCASPERFLRKEGRKLISQPIKGTVRRGGNREQDEQLKQELLHSEKERAENMMIVDLVRNDLSRSCTPGTVAVDEFFGIYTFPQVHQMISTVSGQLREEVNTVDSIRNAFPMGSMTGAPKIRAMQLIEQYEQTKRGLYSGAVGYFSPEDDFDFNVVIRSILYNSEKELLSFEVGSAITYDSDPEAEYTECLLKAKAIRKVLGKED
jgi:para-aminobenzoate synthetase component 1